MKSISLILSTVIALSIMPGCVEEQNKPTEVDVAIINPSKIEKQSISAKQIIASGKDIKKHTSPSRSAKKQASSSFDKPLPTTDSVELPRMKYQVVVENNLFRPLGWKKEVLKETTPKTENPVVENRRERPSPTYNLSLTGIAQNGSQWVAIVEDESKREGYFLHRGEKLKNALVSEIFAEYIILVVGDTKTQLSLGGSIKYNANGEIMLNTITTQKPDLSISESFNEVYRTQIRIPNSDEDVQKSLIERMKARRRKELGQE